MTPAASVVREEVVAPAVVPATSVRRSWWRRPVVERDVVSTEYYTAPTYALDPTLAQFVRVMWYLLGVLEALMAIRFLLALLGANANNGFAALIYGVTGLFVAPFNP